MENIWIIGAGKFGELALRRLSENRKYWRFLLVDSVKENLDRHRGENIRREQADGVIFLKNNLHAVEAPDWIIPSVPHHLAAEWCLQKILHPFYIFSLKLPNDICK